MVVWSFALSAIGVLGIYLAGKKSAWGWLIGFSAQGLWVVFALVTGQYGFIISAIAYGTIYGKNWLAWRKAASADG